MRARATTLASAIALVSYALGATNASALQPGVYASPGSPAGKEYAIPLPSARGQGTGKPVTPGQPGPLFGVGISPPAKGHTATGSAKPRSAGSKSQPRGHRRRGAGSVAAATGAGGRNQVSPQEIASLTHQGSAVPQVALWGALVVLGGLAIGGLFAFLGRRRGAS